MKPLHRGTTFLSAKACMGFGADDLLFQRAVLNAVHVEDEVEGLLRFRCGGERIADSIEDERVFRAKPIT